MRRIIIYFAAVFIFGFSAYAQSNKLKQANDSYIKRDYTQAAKFYEEIISHDGVAPELYYNLGNAYYKSNEIGRSILNYERALRLSPLYDDASFNLDLAQQKVVDNIVQAPTFFLGRWIENLIKVLTSNQWFIFSFIVFILFLGFSFLFLFGSSRQSRKTSFYIGIVFLFFSLISFIFAGVRKDQLQNHHEAIVMQGVVVVKSSPDKSGTDLFQLHEGTKVSIKSSLGQWVEIQLGNGNVGWVEGQSIEKI